MDRDLYKEKLNKAINNLTDEEYIALLESLKIRIINKKYIKNKVNKDK